jgi:hypothetical protein
MENLSMPGDHEEVVFIDNHGVRHQGVYRKVLKAFVDTEGGKDPENVENIYVERRIVDWKYLSDTEDDL